MQNFKLDFKFLIKTEDPIKGSSVELLINKLKKVILIIFHWRAPAFLSFFLKLFPF